MTPPEPQVAAHGQQEADHLFGLLRDRLRVIHGEVDDNRLRQAYEMGLAAHEGTSRLDGQPYIMHPLEVAEICVELNMEEDAIIAALLHDTVEDTAVRLNEIRQRFGVDVANMVDALTKIKRINFFARFTGRTTASHQARNLQKLFVAMTRDTRVIVIKLADRLHNMRTLESMPEHKQRRISRETLEFYIPIARRLGLGQMVGELEDLVFMHLYPDRYLQLKEEVDKKIPEEEPRVAEVIEEVRRLLMQHGIGIERIYGRRKHLWSIFRKMELQSVGLDGIYDLVAIRIVIRGQALDCYRVLGLLHLRYQPIFHRFRDFISSPKENGYQTLHTTIIGPEASRVECQIRTVEMDREATHGIAAHWRYKEVGRPSGHLIKDDAWLEFIRELAEETVDSEDFVTKTRDTLLGDSVLVLSPMHEVVNLPVGSTPIDFAYFIHTDLGHAIRSARVNGQLVPLDYELRNGDVVEVIKSDEIMPTPRPEWLVLAKSPKSLLKIRKYFKGRPRADRIAAGRNLLRQHIVKEGLYPLNLTANDKLAALLKRLPVSSIDDLYDKVALGKFQCDEIVDHLKDIHRAKVDSAKDQLKPGEQASRIERALSGYAGDLGVRLAGGSPLRRRCELAQCCTPVPGDKIYGVTNRVERRLRVHRIHCEQLEAELGEGELMELEWLPDLEGARYPARVAIVSFNRVGLLFEVLRYLSSRNIHIWGAEFDNITSATRVERHANFELILAVETLAELTDCLEQIAKMDDVFEATRLIKPEGGNGKAEGK